MKPRESCRKSKSFRHRPAPMPPRYYNFFIFVKKQKIGFFICTTMTGTDGSEKSYLNLELEPWTKPFQESRPRPEYFPLAFTTHWCHHRACRTCWILQFPTSCPPRCVCVCVCVCLYTFVCVCVFKCACVCMYVEGLF